MSTQTATAKPTTIRETTINGLRVIYLGPSALVASESEPGAWHFVDEGRECTCADRFYRGTICKHMQAVALAMELDRANAVPVAEPTRLERALAGTSARDLLWMPED